MKQNRLSHVLAVAGAVALLGGAALAHAETGHSSEQDGTPFLSAKLGIVQAIQAAESQSGGKAASADFSRQNGQEGPAYEIEIIKPDGTQQQLSVNAETGAVRTSALKQGDGDSEQDGEQEDSGQD